MILMGCFSSFLPCVSGLLWVSLKFEGVMNRLRMAITRGGLGGIACRQHPVWQEKGICCKVLIVYFRLILRMHALN